MRTVITSDGTIENTGDLQVTALAIPDVAIVEPEIVAPVPRSTAAAGVYSGGNALRSLTAQASALTLESPASTTVQAAAQPVSVVTSAGSPPFAPVVINPTFGVSILNKVSTVADPTTSLQLQTAITSTIAILQNRFASFVPVSTSPSIVVNITFDYGFLNGGALTAQSGSGQSQGNAAALDYATIKQALPALPATDPIPLAHSFYVTDSQIKTLGIPNVVLNGTTITATSNEVDGFVGLNTIANGVTLAYDPNNQSVTGQIGVIGLLEHEITEVLGRVSILGNTLGGATPFYSILDLFRYSAPGTRVLTAGTPAYFSTDNGVTNGVIENGVTHFGIFNTAAGGDAADWLSSAVPADAIDAFLTTGTAGVFSALDSTVMSSIGLTATCFQEGTRIQTSAGMRPIETLAPDDTVLTLLGGPGKVVWVGRREMDLTAHPKPELAWPVRVRAGAFAPGLPSRNLYLSPDHAIYAEGVLIPVKCLINGTSVVQMKVDHVVYWHVELQQHDVVLAEGLPAETYLDAGDRATFAGGNVVALYTDFAARRWEMTACAPMTLTGPEVEAVRQRLADRTRPFAVAS